MRGKGPRIALAAASLGLSVSMGLLASAYTTAGMTGFYAQQRDRYDPASTYRDDLTLPYSSAAYVPPTRYRLASADRDATDSLSYPPIPTPR